MEHNYEFRKRLLAVHRRDIRDEAYQPTAGMAEIDEQYVIAIARDCGRVLQTAALDLQDYFFTTMGVSLAVKKYETISAVTGTCIVIATCAQLGRRRWADAPAASCEISCDAQGVVICGIDERGSAQGCYRLEDQMNEICAPYLPMCTKRFSPAFSPRMTHSGYGLDNYPDAHLSAIAHAGMDAILVFAKGVDQTPTGYLDFNELVYRAEKYGLDVYAYIYFESSLHPDDAAAFAYYDSTYGSLFQSCPGLKGMVLVGESVEFPSKDPRVSDKTFHDNNIDGVYTGKPTAGWFPCADYNRWIALLQRVVGQYKPDADIVFWTYNWGYAPAEDRLALIDSLPPGISLMVTFEMFEQRTIGALQTATVDYTLSFAGPSAYFISEAERAKARGIRLYAQANSGGLTWDFGVIPYEPCPNQWAKRYEALLDAKARYGLCGIMENHHYGFWPSFISDIEKRMLTVPPMGAQAAIAATARMRYGAQNEQAALRAWRQLSEAIDYYVCTNEDQYGPFRIGPAYPMVFRSDVQIPTVAHAHFGGNKICFTEYASDALYKITSHTMGKTGMIQQRIPAEMACLQNMLSLLRGGREALTTIPLTAHRREENLRLINLIQFMENSVQTVLHVKRWNLCKWRIRSEQDSAVIRQLLEELMAIGLAEIENARDTIALVRADSRLGWEPSMAYMADEAHLEWKIRQTHQVVTQELPRYLHSLQAD